MENVFVSLASVGSSTITEVEVLFVTKDEPSCSVVESALRERLDWRGTLRTTDGGAGACMV